MGTNTTWMMIRGILKVAGALVLLCCISPVSTRAMDMDKLLQSLGNALPQSESDAPIFYDASKMKDQCDSWALSVYCEAYSVGVADTLSYAGTICLFVGIKADDIVEVSKTSFTSTDDGRVQAAVPIARALQNHFPCPPGVKTESGGFYNGNTLYDKCNSYFGSRVCRAYMAGVLDTARGRSVDGITVCLAKGVTMEQASDIILNSFKQNVGDRHLTAASLILVAIYNAGFKC